MANCYVLQILVTHHVDLVRPGAHYLVRMLDGRIDTQGTIKDLEARGMLEAILQDESAAKPATESGVRTPSDDAETIAEAAVEGKPVEDAAHPRTDTESTAVAPTTKKKEARKLVEEEKKATGSVKWQIYRTYLEAAGWFVWAVLIFGLGASQVCLIPKEH